MKNLFKLFLGIFLAILVSGNVCGQETATIGTGTSTNYYPMPGFWGYQYDVYLYTPSAASFLSSACTISSIAWNISSGSTNSAQMTIWIKDVDASTTLSSSNTFSSFTSGATQVYSGSRTTSTGWNTYNFSSNFSHQAGKALLVAVRGVGCSTSGGCSRSCYYTSATSTHWYKHADGSTDPGTSTTGTSVDGNRSNIQVTYTAGSSWFTGTATSYYITNFTTMGGTTNINNTTSGTGLAYSDYYNSYSATFAAGSTVNFSIGLNGTGTYGHAIWVDWNQNGTFESSERVHVTSGYSSGPHTGSFTIQSGTAVGNYRVRILADYYSSVPSNPLQGNTGEIEDYKLIVSPPPTYTVTFNANGGSGTMTSQTFTYNVSQALTSNTFTNPGYEFAGWNRAADGSGTSYSDGQSITVNSDMTLYAQWNCLPPTNVQVAEQSENYLITWDGEAQSYTVYVYMVTKYENVTENELEVLLYPGENYYVRVESICGESANSSEFQSSGTPLPITLINFTGVPRSKYNHIEWTTATEKNNDYFILESSIDAVHFNEIYRISGAGNSIEALDYDFKDYNPVANITYYRLTQVDYDGSKTTSDIIECKRTSEEKTSKRIMVYPNPAKDEVTIINAEGANILIINQLGQIVLSLENATDNQTINVTNFANGTYFIKAGAETVPFNIVK